MFLMRPLLAGFERPLTRWHRKQQINYWVYRIFYGMSYTDAQMQAFYVDL